MLSAELSMSFVAGQPLDGSGERGLLFLDFRVEFEMESLASSKGVHLAPFESVKHTKHPNVHRIFGFYQSLDEPPKNYTLSVC